MPVVRFILSFCFSIAHADYFLVPDSAPPVPQSAPAGAVTSRAATPRAAADKPAAPRPTSPKPAPPCTSATSDVRELVSKFSDRDLFKLALVEDVPKVGDPGRFELRDVGGQVRINMINGAGQSVGVAPAKFCLKVVRGQPELRVGVQRSSLKFGKKNLLLFEYDLDAKVDAMLASLPNPGELPLVVTRGQNGKVHIADGVDGKFIDSDFSTARR